MDNFTLYNPTDILFGKNVEDLIGEEIKKYGSKVLFHYGEGSIKESGLYSRVLEILNKAGVQLIELGGVESNPKLSLVNRGIEFCKKNNIDFILAVGGGSVVDSAKAIALGAKYDGEVWDFFDNNDIEPEEVLPLGVILTNPGSGSESSDYTVLTNEEKQVKKSYEHGILYPKFSALNPELCFTLEDKQISASAVEIISHLIERYILNRKNVEITNRLIEGTMITVINNVLKVLENNESYEGFSELLWSAAVSQNSILGAGTRKKLACHDLENKICALYDIDHATVLSIIYPAFMKYIEKEHGDRLGQLGRRVFKINNIGLNKEELVNETANKLKEFYEKINMKTRLSELGIKEEELLNIADSITNGGKDTIGEYIKLNKEDIYNIYKLAY